MNNFHNKVAKQVVSKLRGMYPNGYNQGDEVLVPLNSVAYCRALIKNSNDHSGRGYNVVGPDSWDPWERWVRLEHIKPTNMFDLIEMYCIEDYREIVHIEKRVMELLYE